eukprot:TRINITY_DN66041_c0_g1_i1.p1 TRINITY_DN66041_c0_g1~~TRINITY_DN66041_c0_g1_i1.p1  ORF type:complete len:508 (+),score=206.43 TRINITY_DN66041_c0_g1_i1:101-1624(+)
MGAGGGGPLQAVLALLLCSWWHPGEAAGAKTAAEILKEVPKLMGKGRAHYKECLSLLDRAHELDPKDANVLEKRAELNELLRRYTDATNDLDGMLALRPDAKRGYQMRARILPRVGRFGEARRDWDVLAGIYQRSNSQHERTKKLSEAKEKAVLYKLLDSQLRAVSHALEKNPKDASVNSRCVEVMQRLTKEARDTDEFQVRLIECAIASRQFDVAQSQLTGLQAKQPQSLRAFELKALLLKNMGAIEAARNVVRQCLSVDPEHKPCMGMYKSLKKYMKHTEKLQGLVDALNWHAVTTSVEEAFALDPDPHNRDQLFHWRCKSYLETRNLEKGVDGCTEGIEDAGTDSPNAWELYLMRADLHMTANDLAKAEEDLNKAGELNSQERRVQQAKHRLEKLKKMAARKDYYKILGVERTATEKDIKRAFRKLAMQHHPDKWQDADKLTEQEREALKQKFQDINEANHVLTDEDKRRKYDLGEDIDINPDQHGGWPSHGFPFGNFHFRFNG